ncbi:hypothetical protein [Streptomyces sp. NPDC053431]
MNSVDISALQKLSSESEQAGGEGAAFPCTWTCVDYQVTGCGMRSN